MWEREVELIKILLHSKTTKARLRKWRWPVTKTYNGFTGEERIRGWQVSHWLQDTDQLLNLSKQSCQCSICGKLENISYHNENYYEPWTAKLVCKSCHFYLHARFRNPNGLEILRTRAGHNEPENWVLGISKSKIDLALKLRKQYGKEVCEFPSLKNSKYVFPFNQLYGLS